MSDLAQLNHSLNAYFAAVDSQKTDQPLDLGEPIAQLEIFSSQPPADFHPQLKHFLESRSYRKAWTWLQGEAPAKGSCGK